MVGFTGQVEANPLFEITEGASLEICMGILSGTFASQGEFTEFTATLLPVEPGTVGEHTKAI